MRHRLISAARLTTALVAGLSAAPALAQDATTPSRDAAAGPTPVAAERAAPPRLVVAIVVDQLSANLFNQYRPRFTGGLKTLLDEGLVYANGYQRHAVTETCPGHATVLTGVDPAVVGVPANDWVDRATGREVYCLAAPANTLAHGRNTDNGPVGPDQLGATNLSDWIKARDPSARVYAVSGKDRGAITLAGAQGDGVFWFTDDFGFTTYVEPGRTAEDRLAPVAALNARINARLAASPPGWDYSREECRALAADWPIEDGVFRSALPPERFILDTSPILDELTLEAATVFLDEADLGAGDRTDVLGISLSATDRIGHVYGPQGPEMCEQMVRLDAALGTFLERLRAIPGGAVVVLTADHGGADFPERASARGQHEARRPDATLLPRLNATLRERFSLSVGPITPGASGLMVTGEGGRGLPAPLRDDVAAAAVDLLRAEPTVAGAWTQGQVLASPQPSSTTGPQELTLLERQKLSAVPERSPDIMVAYAPGLGGRARLGGTLTGHGTPWDYDRRVPIVFWSSARSGQAGQERPLPIRTIDIAPTLAHVLDLPTPETVAGRCLDLGLFAVEACPVEP